MKEALIVAIVFGSFVLIPAVIGGTILLSIKLLKGGTSRKDQAEDSKIIQEIYQGLSRMEETCGGTGNHPAGSRIKRILKMRNYDRLSRDGIYRSRNGVIFGVCRGLAEHFDFSVFWARAIAIIFLLVSGFWPAIGLYLVAALLMKPAPVIPIETEAEQEFYDSYTNSRHLAAQPHQKTV